MLIGLTHQLVNWKINQTTSRWAHMCGGEREGANPKDACYGALPLEPRSTPSIKVWLSLVNPKPMRLISVKSHWFRNLDFLHYLINLSIKIINIWFLGFSDLSDGKITQKLGKVGLWVYWVLWVRKWAPPWLKLDSEPTFLTKPFFPFRLLKNSLCFGKIKTLKKKN